MSLANLLAREESKGKRGCNVRGDHLLHAVSRGRESFSNLQFGAQLKGKSGCKCAPPYLTVPDQSVTLFACTQPHTTAHGCVAFAAAARSLLLEIRRLRRQLLVLLHQLLHLWGLGVGGWGLGVGVGGWGLGVRGLHLLLIDACLELI